MRKLMLSALLGLASLGFAMPNQAKASWLSEALHDTHFQLNIGSQYPAYVPAPQYSAYAPPPAYAPVPVPTYAPPAYDYCPQPSYPAYRPVPVYTPTTVAPSYSSYRPVPVYTPTPVAPSYSYRPVPVPPQYWYYGPVRNDYRHDWRDDRNDRDWRR